MPDADTLKFSPLAEDSKREILAAYMVNPDISLLDKVKIQAQVLMPVLRAFRAALGAEQADQIVHTALREWSHQLFRDIGAQIEGSPMQKWAALRAAISPKANENVDFEMLRQEPEAIDANVTGCRYAEFFRRLGELDLGALLTCEADFDLVAVGNPDVELNRTQTIMKGASYCDFRYRLKKAVEPK